MYCKITNFFARNFLQKNNENYKLFFIFDLIKTINYDNRSTD